MKERGMIFNAEMVRAILDGRKTQTRRLIKPQPVLSESSGFCWKGGAFGLGATHRDTQRNFSKFNCPFGVQGDRLWVRETFVLENTYEYHGDHHVPDDGRPVKTGDCPDGCNYLLIPHYRATEPEPNIVPYDAALDDENDDRTRWTPSIHMPRWASRILLEITDIRVERLQDISETDAIAEGVQPNCCLQDHTDCDHGGEWFRYGSGYDGFPAFSAKESYESFWQTLYGNWSKNPWVWVIEFKRIEAKN